MTKKQKPDADAFTMLPLRALSDGRLTGLHLRVLGIIAFHDRRSGPRKQGAGCWATHNTMCEEIGCNYNNLSSAIIDLVKFGYLQSDKNPRDKRQRVYIVVYEHDKGSSSIGELSAKIVRPETKIVRQRGELSRAPNELQDIDKHEGTATESAPKRAYNRAYRGIDFTKVTPIDIGDKQKWLAIFEKKLKRKVATDEEVEACRTLCNQIINDPHAGYSEFYQADRMLADYDELDPPKKPQPMERKR